MRTRRDTMQCNHRTVMNTFERYLFKKLFISLAAIISALLLIFVGRLLIQLMDRVADNLYSLDALMPFLVIGIINSLIYILIFAALIATILTLRKCYYDNELTAAFSLRISRLCIYKVLYYFGVPLALLLLYIAMEVTPHFNEQYRIIKESSKQDVGLRMIPSGQFIKLDDGNVLFVEQRSDDSISGIFLSNQDGSVVETAPLGTRLKETQAGNAFKLSDGVIYQRDRNQAEEEFSIFRYLDHKVWLQQKELSFRYKPSMMDWHTLRKDDSIEAQVELQRRLAMPIHLLLLLLFAEPLSRTRPRQSSYIRPLIAVIVFLAYMNSVSFVAHLIEDQRVPVYPGVWSVPLAAALLLAVWTVYQHKRGDL